VVAVSEAQNAGAGEFQVGPDGLIDELPCRDCGAPTLSVLEVFRDGAPAFWAYVCRPCQGKQADEMTLLRARFDAMIAAGVSRETANAVMIRWHVRSTA
jgi:hypothetical protein